VSKPVNFERIRRLLEEIESSLAIARSMVSVDYASFLRDVRNRYTLRLALVEVVEAATSLGLCILRDLGVRRVEGYSQVFRKPVEHGVLSLETGEGMKRLARPRNPTTHSTGRSTTPGYTGRLRAAGWGLSRGSLRR